MIDHIRTIRICSVYVGPDYPTAPGSSPPTVLNKVGILSLSLIHISEPTRPY